MTSIKTYTYSSTLAPYIADFISQKRELGFIYNNEAYNLQRLDKYWLDNGYADEKMTYERLSGWYEALNGEGKGGQANRIGTTRMFALYMNSIGIESHVFLDTVRVPRPIVHILDKKEINELFGRIDSYVPRTSKTSDLRMAYEYPIFFRFLYCCGMRNGEACALKVSDVDLNKGVITIEGGKNRKDRLVYMADDLRQLAISYLQKLTHDLGQTPKWFFPGRCPDKHLRKNKVDEKFSIFWNETTASTSCDKKPTPHCLRHTYVVNRINLWALAGLDLSVMLVYLSKYLGHSSPDESFYYYHLAEEAFKIVRQHDSYADNIIPEVRRR